MTESELYWNNELYWFAGIIDGEGSFQLCKSKNQYSSICTITNTNTNTIFDFVMY